MAFTIAGPAIDPHNGLNTDGLTCDAFNEETWFPSSSPVANTAEPGTPDATDTSGPTGGSGQSGHYLITVPKSGSYWVACYNVWDPTVIAWTKVLSHPHTQWQGWTAAVDVTASRGFFLTTIASGSNGVALPHSTINVASTTGFPSAGFLQVVASGAYTTVQYTGTSGGTQFTGCTGGTGTMATGGRVNNLYRNGVYRRLAVISISSVVITASDSANLEFSTTLGGSFFGATVAPGLGNGTGTSGTNYVTGIFSATLPVDPLGLYGGWANVAGTGEIGLQRWLEVDF